MLRAAIFDDEYIVLQGLKRMIDWSRYGVELAGTADNGHTALELVRSHQPDIILTDIRMPGMDGLQLIEAVMREKPDTVCIVFSGFNEFEYVRRAIGLGVIDYLEKPITIDKIEATMKKTMERIEKEQQFGVMKQRYEASRRDLLEKAVLDLLFVGAAAENKLYQQLGLQAQEIAGVTVIALNGKSTPAIEHPCCRVVQVSTAEEQLLVLFHLGIPGENADVDQHKTEPIWEYLLTLEETEQSVYASGRTYSSLADAARSWREARKALRYACFFAETGWVRFEDVGEEKEDHPELSEWEEALVFSLRACDQDGLQHSLDAFEQWTGTARLTPERVEQEMLKLLFLGADVLRETGEDASQALPSMRILYQELNTLDTLENMFGWCRSRMEKLLHVMEAVRGPGKHNAVRQATVYMEQHYGQSLSLPEVAEHVGMNANYFSLLFKEEMGISYIKYLTRIRMEHAKRLLIEGMRVHEASEKTGYYNHRHFGEVFKRTFGMTPGQYRESHGRGQTRGEP
ncbi:response regulator [Paenibacillus shenyangensis]|uniref:response regulator n=1 Tax=Paenibacillus sp. A9 TaxID=1284352 RepID=UPI00036369E6|nr:response regulator [Paenibacillus sp. A9]